MKKHLKIGDEIWFWEPPSWAMSGIVLEVDSHPLEYDLILIKQTDSPCEDEKHIWVSEKNVELKSDYCGKRKPERKG